MARQREGDVSTFHFIDNLSRAIRHGGRILLDLIPKVYSTERMIRVLGEDMQPAVVKVAPTGESVQPQVNEVGQVIGHVFDITAGKYDLTVAAGPSYTSRREEVTAILTDVMRSIPDAAPFLASRLAKVLDLPDADELANELKVLNPALKQQQQGGVSPEIQEQMQQGLEIIQQQQAQIEQLQTALKDKAADRQIEMQKLQVDEFRAQTERMKAAIEAARPTQVSQPPSYPAAA